MNEAWSIPGVISETVVEKSVDESTIVPPSVPISKGFPEAVHRNRLSLFSARAKKEKVKIQVFIFYFLFLKFKP